VLSIRHLGRLNSETFLKRVWNPCIMNTEVDIPWSAVNIQTYVLACILNMHTDIGINLNINIVPILFIIKITVEENKKYCKLFIRAK